VLSLAYVAAGVDELEVVLSVISITSSNPVDAPATRNLLVAAAAPTILIYE